MRIKLWPFKKRKPHIILGGKKIEVRPLLLKDTISLVLLMAPYWPIITRHLPNIRHAMLEKDQGLLTGIFMVLRDEMRQTPGDIVKVVSLLSGVESDFIARHATANEIVAALPVLDKVHDFRRLWRILEAGRIYLGD